MTIRARVLWNSGGEGGGGGAGAGSGSGSGSGGDPEKVSELRALVKDLRRQVTTLEGERDQAATERDMAREKLTAAQGKLDAAAAVEKRKEKFETIAAKVPEGKELTAEGRKKAWEAYSKLPANLEKAAEDAEWAVGLFSSAAGGGKTVLGGTPEESEKEKPPVNMNDVIRAAAGAPSRAI
jgi:outer membrane murein-binding lipoprotein Lpp/ferredoxin